MRTVTTQTDVYKYQELTDEAKERARQWYAQGVELMYGGEMDTVKGVANAFGVNLVSWEIAPYYHSHIRVEPAYHFGPDEETLHEWVRRCFAGLKVEGWYLDGVARNLIKQAAKDLPLFADEDESEECAKDLVKFVFDGLCDAIQTDMEYQISAEAAEEGIEANEYEFTKDGKPYF